MSDDSSNRSSGKLSNTSSQHGDESAGPLAGQRLAEARRANDISISEIAKELHLDEPKVQALEENQFFALGAPVFAKGHLRKYAALVNVPIDDVLADYYQLNRAAGAPPVVGPKRRRPQTFAVGPWIVGAVIVAVVGGVLYWWFTREPAAESAGTPGALAPFATDSVTDGQSEGEPQQPADGAAADIADNADVPIVDTPVQEAPETPAADPVTDAAAGAPTSERPPADQLRLAMTFSGDCWTEVTDANGRRLFFGLGQAGQTVTRDGTPPLRALFGDRYNVSITLNGVDYPLDRAEGRGNTARVTLDTP